MLKICLCILTDFAIPLVVSMAQNLKMYKPSKIFFAICGNKNQKNVLQI